MPFNAPAYALRPVLAISPAAPSAVWTRSPRLGGSTGRAVSGRGDGALVRARVVARGLLVALRAPADAALERAFGLAAARDFAGDAAFGFALVAAFGFARAFGFAAGFGDGDDAPSAAPPPRFALRRCGRLRGRLDRTSRSAMCVIQ